MKEGLRKFGKNWLAIAHFMDKMDLWQCYSKIKILRLRLRFHPDDKDIELLDIMKKPMPKSLQ